MDLPRCEKSELLYFSDSGLPFLFKHDTPFEETHAVAFSNLSPNALP